MRSDIPIIQSVAEYTGQTSIAVAATQLDVPRAEATRIVGEWCEFFSAGPTPILELEFRSRTPHRLFDTLRSQSQLRRLEVKWGDYSDLSVLTPMTVLEELLLGGAVAVESLSPLSGMRSLRRLTLEGTRGVHDYAPLGDLDGLRILRVTDGMNGPRLHADSLDFVAGLIRLEQLYWSPIVDSRDYSAALRLGHVETIGIVETRGMTPSMADLEWSLPGVQKHMRERAEVVIPVRGDGQLSGEFRVDIEGRMRFHPED